MRFRPVLPALILLASVLASLLAGCGASGDDARATTAVVPGQPGVSLPDLIDAVRPSVVAILRQDGGEGSGVVWSSEGIIVTNDHVVRGVREVDVAFSDGQRVPGEVLASDPRTDLAVVRAARDDLPAATFRDDLPRVGELAIAIGAPLGFEQSATAGIISGVGRSIPGSALVSPALVDLIQTDAAISPGNSGGALVGADGRVIGVNVAYIPPEAGAVSIGFAIPAPTVVDVVEQLLDDGQVEHAYLGVQPVTVDPQTAAAYGLAVEAGAAVTAVVAGSPAAAAGLRPGDVVVAFGDTRVESAEDLLAALRRARPGDRVTLTFVRGEDETTVDVVLGDLPRG